MLLLDAVVFRNRDIESLPAIARSGLPSPSRSPIATALGSVQVGKRPSEVNTKSPTVDPFLINRARLVAGKVTTMSGLLSWFRSPMAMSAGGAPIMISCLVNDNPPTAEVFLNTLIVASPVFRVTRSGLPSLSISPTARRAADECARKFDRMNEEPVMVPPVIAFRSTVTWLALSSV